MKGIAFKASDEIIDRWKLEKNHTEKRKKLLEHIHWFYNFAQRIDIEGIDERTGKILTKIRSGHK